MAHQVRGGVRHASRVARWADAAPFTREGQEELVAAGFADGACEAMRVEAALEVAPKFGLDLLRQGRARALVRVAEEALEVLLDDAIEDGLLGAALLVRLLGGSGHCGRASATAVPQGQLSFRGVSFYGTAGERRGRWSLAGAFG